MKEMTKNYTISRVNEKNRITLRKGYKKVLVFTLKDKPDEGQLD